MTNEYSIQWNKLETDKKDRQSKHVTHVACIYLTVVSAH